MDILKTVGEVLVGIGLFGGAFLPDWISGYTKAERMGKVKHADTPRKRKKKWLLVLLFLAVAAVGAGLIVLSSGNTPNP